MLALNLDMAAAAGRRQLAQDFVIRSPGIRQGQLRDTGITANSSSRFVVRAKSFLPDVFLI